MMHSVANREHDSRSDTETRLLCFQVNEEYFVVFWMMSGYSDGK